ncbi:hypothetical protein BN135_680 [Cronobacter muytjensii 530]
MEEHPARNTTNHINHLNFTQLSFPYQCKTMRRPEPQRGRPGDNR